MKCYLDKSDGVDDAGDQWLTLVGFAATDAMWRKFDDGWRRILWERYPVAPYIHMTHMVARKDPFERATGWDQDKLGALVFDAVRYMQALDKSRFMFTRCSINVSARRRLIDQGHPVPDVVILCAELCLGPIFRWHYIINGNFRELMNVYFDQGEEFCRWFRKRWLTNRTPPGRVNGSEQLFWDMIADVDERDSKFSYPLQAADMVAWGHSRGLITRDRPFRHLSHIMHQVIPHWRTDLTEDILRLKNPKPLPTQHEQSD